jgi:predicted dehydrogenase
MAFPHDWHRDLIADFLDAAAANREPAIPGSEALRVHCLIDALLRSAREKRAIQPES